VINIIKIKKELASQNVYSSSLTCSTVVQVTWYQVTRSRDPFEDILGVLLRNRRFRKIRPSGAFLPEVTL
jgi:hypothetical protein